MFGTHWGGPLPSKERGFCSRWDDTFNEELFQVNCIIFIKPVFFGKKWLSNSYKVSIQEKQQQLSASDVPDTMQSSENKEMKAVFFIFKKPVSSMGTGINHLKVDKNQNRNKQQDFIGNLWRSIHIRVESVSFQRKWSLTESEVVSRTSKNTWPPLLSSLFASPIMI